MTLFPGSHAQIYRNEVGEVIGWDYPSYDDSPSDNDDWYDNNYEQEPEELEPWECREKGLHGDSGTGSRTWFDWISGGLVNGRNAGDHYSWLTGRYEDVYQQRWECDYCQEPFWSYWD